MKNTIYNVEKISRQGGFDRMADMTVREVELGDGEIRYALDILPRARTTGKLTGVTECYLLTATQWQVFSGFLR